MIALKTPRYINTIRMMKSVLLQDLQTGCMLAGKKRLENLAAVERRKRQQIKDCQRDVHHQ